MGSPDRAYAAHRRTTKEKVHRREIRLGRRAFSVLSLRPGTRHRFATNRSHETWHILCDAGSAHFLGRLLWALSYQRRPETVLVVDDPFLVPNPFDADPSMPFVFVNRSLTGFGRQEARDLARALPVGSRPSHRNPAGTVVMNCQSRPVAIDEGRWADVASDTAPEMGGSATWAAGLIVFGHTTGQLRANSLAIDLFDDMKHPIDALYLDTWPPSGEIQTLSDFPGRVSRARRRRHRRFPGREHDRLNDDERRMVW